MCLERAAKAARIQPRIVDFFWKTYFCAFHYWCRTRNIGGVGLGSWIRRVVGSLGPRGGGSCGPVMLTTSTSVLAVGFECGHEFSACKTYRDQTCELWWCMNFLLSYLFLFVECPDNWFMTWLQSRNALPPVYPAGTVVRRSITSCPVQRIPI